MKTTLINYADGLYRKSQHLNSKTGKAVGGFDAVIPYSPKDIDKEFRSSNKEILCQERGNGYWLWKPYFIWKTLSHVDDGDIVFYCDAGVSFIHEIAPLSVICLEERQDIVFFELKFLEKEFSKRDAFVFMDCDSSAFTESRQRIGSYHLWRKSDFTMQFIREYLDFATDPRVLTDMDNQCGLPNYPEFRDHRHDQSIFSLLTKKHGLVAHRDPSQYGNSERALYPNSSYAQLIDHTRKRNFSMKHKFRKYARKFGINN